MTDVRKNEFRIMDKNDIESVKEYLDEQFQDTVENMDILRNIISEEEIRKNDYKGVGELKIEIKITHII